MLDAVGRLFFHFGKYIPDNLGGIVGCLGRARNLTKRSVGSIL
jgi:hypothetical protein